MAQNECPECGEPIRNGDKECGECGTSFEGFTFFD